MDLKSFRESFVKIEPIEGTGAYGHHPFQLIAVTADGGNEINALFIQKMHQVIKRVKEYIAEEAKEIFLSLDFPAGNGIPNDFVLCLHLVAGKSHETMVIEYSTEDGSVFKESSGDDYPLVCEIVRYFVAHGENPCI